MDPQSPCLGGTFTLHSNSLQWSMWPKRAAIPPPESALTPCVALWLQAWPPEPLQTGKRGWDVWKPIWAQNVFPIHELENVVVREKFTEWMTLIAFHLGVYLCLWGASSLHWKVIGDQGLRVCASRCYPETSLSRADCLRGTFSQPGQRTPTSDVCRWWGHRAAQILEIP